MATKTRAIALIIFTTFIVAIAQILLKKGMQQSLILNLALFGGLLAYFVGSILFVIALRYGELSVLYPIFASSYIWVSILSPKFFPSDSMNLEKWIGVSIIMLGVYLIALGGKNAN